MYNTVASRRLRKGYTPKYECIKTNSTTEFKTENIGNTLEVRMFISSVLILSMFIIKMYYSNILIDNKYINRIYTEYKKDYDIVKITNNIIENSVKNEI